MFTGTLITVILEILAAAWLLGYIFSRLGLPFVLGELLAGLIIGPPLLGLVSYSETLEFLAEFGIFFVMFYAGMELDPRILLKNAWPSITVALGGFVIPFALGVGVTYLFGGTAFQCLFVGMGISVTAIAVQAVVLQSMRINRSQLGHVIIGAAIVDDILSLMGLSVLLSLARHGTVDVAQLLILLVKVGAFFGITVVLGVFVMPPFTRRLTDEAGKAFTFAIAVGLAMAHLAELAGLHHIIGAFVAGQFVRRGIVTDEIYHTIATRFYGISYGFLVPIFFVSLSFHLKLEASWDFLVFTTVLTLAAVGGKLLGSGIPLRLHGHSKWESLVVGFGMNGRGAVELVIASVVLSESRELMSAGIATAPLLTGQQFSALILMAFVTTLLAPITLRWSVLKTCQHDEGVDFCALLDTEPRS